MNSGMSLRIGSLLAVAGIVIFLAGGAPHPANADPADSPAAFREYAASAAWIRVHLLQFLGFAALLGALLTLATPLSVSGGAVSLLARLGSGFVVAALAVLAALQAVDGISLKKMVDVWVAAPQAQRDAAFAAAEAVRWIEVGLNAVFRQLLGVAVGLCGLAAALSHVYPKWFGWAGTVVGLGVFLGGLLTAYAGFSRTPLGGALAMFVVAFHLWLLVGAVLMWRIRQPDAV